MQVIHNISKFSRRVNTYVYVPVVIRMQYSPCEAVRGSCKCRNVEQMKLLLTVNVTVAGSDNVECSSLSKICSRRSSMVLLERRSNDRIWTFFGSELFNIDFICAINSMSKFLFKILSLKKIIKQEVLLIRKGLELLYFQRFN